MSAVRFEGKKSLIEEQSLSTGLLGLGELNRERFELFFKRAFVG